MGRRPKSCAPFTQVRFGEEQMPPDQSRGIEQTPPSTHSSTGRQRFRFGSNASIATSAARVRFAHMTGRLSRVH